MASLAHRAGARARRRPAQDPDDSLTGRRFRPVLFGQISFEVFGRFEGLVGHPELLFDHAVVFMAWSLGIDTDRGRAVDVDTQDRGASP